MTKSFRFVDETGEDCGEIVESEYMDRWYSDNDDGDDTILYHVWVKVPHERDEDD